MTTEAAAPPTAREARRAADELAAGGASQVLLFGSVAHGEATTASDIDLVAVFDDIDYSQRHRLTSALSTAAEAAVGRQVEVFVTDRAEWRRRCKDVTASFEAGIAPEAIVLIDGPVGSVRWDKEIGLPDNNTDEALGRLDEANKALWEMHPKLRPGEWEVLEPQDDQVRLWRMIGICSFGAIAVETAIKALAAVDGTPAPHKHRIDLLVPLAGSRSDSVRAALADLEQTTIGAEEGPYGDLTIWRKAGTYIASRPDIDLAAVSALAPIIARAAVTVTGIAADEIAAHAPDARAVARARRHIDQTVAILDQTAYLDPDDLTRMRARPSRDTGRDYDFGR